MNGLVRALKYLNDNCYKDRNYLISKLNSKFKYTKDKAIKIYYYWKSKFMNTLKCIPNTIKIEVKPKFKIIDNLIIGKYGEYKKLDSCIVVGYHFFNTIHEIEKYRHFRLRSNLKSMDNILDEAIEVMKVVGLA